MIVEKVIELELRDSDMIDVLMRRGLIQNKKILGLYMLSSIMIDFNPSNLNCMTVDKKGGYRVGGGTPELCAGCNARDICKDSKSKSKNDTQSTTAIKRIDCYSRDRE
jgi:hypothetical protein